jgi:hypothetical protein
VSVAPQAGRRSGVLAQPAEQRTFNPLVQGSIPWRPTSLIPAKSASDQAIRAAQGRIDQRLPMQLDAAWSGFLRVDVANTCVRFR